MLTVSNLSKSFGVETIFTGVSFTLNAGERLGLVGPNGSGKTTLLRILMGQERPDSGSVRFDPPGLRTGYLAQGFEIPPQETLGGYLTRMEGDVFGLSARLETLAIELADPERQDYADLQQEYDRVLGQLEITAKKVDRGPELLAALGLDTLPAELPVGKLSGGQKTRLALAGILLSSPQLLLLDEPTNHLDLGMLEWLEGWLTRSPNQAGRGMLIVSHDRAFIDAVATGILELDPQSHKLRVFPGNYSDYLEAKVAERERQWQAYSDQQEEISRLRHAASAVRDKARFKRGGKGDSGDKFAKGFFGNRTLETMRRAKSLERRLERLLTEERLEKPRSSWQMKFAFGDIPVSGKDVLRLEGLAVGYPGTGDKGKGDIHADVPYSPSPLSPLVLLKDLNLTIRQGARVALVGPNGAGKTTLVWTIVGLLPPLAGEVHLGANVHTGYMAQEQEDLDQGLDAFSTIRRLAPLSDTDVRTFLHQYLFTGDDVFVPVGQLSFGERARLSLACLVARGCNLLLLDEPVNHLDIPSRSRFEEALAGFEGTVLAVVHDRYFIEGFATEVWEVLDSGLQRWETRVIGE